MAHRSSEDLRKCRMEAEKVQELKKKRSDTSGQMNDKAKEVKIL